MKTIATPREMLSSLMDGKTLEDANGLEVFITSSGDIYTYIGLPAKSIGVRNSYFEYPLGVVETESVMPRGLQD